jgi:hypothetical protein
LAALNIKAGEQAAPGPSGNRAMITQRRRRPLLLSWGSIWIALRRPDRS